MAQQNRLWYLLHQEHLRHRLRQPRQKRCEEEEAQRAAVHAQAAAKNAAIEAKREAYWEQVKTQNYLQGKAMLEAVLMDSGLSDKEKAEIQEKLKTEGVAAGLELTVAKVEALGAPGGGKPLASPVPRTPMPPGLPPEAQYAFLHGGSAAQKWIDDNKAKLQAEHQAQLDKAKHDAQAKDTAAYYSAQAAAWLGIDKYVHKPEAPICGPEDIQQEKPWWETTVDFIDNHQTGASIGVGAVVGLAAIGITLAVVGAVTWPVLLVAAGVAAVAAGVAVATGTVALNTHYERPPETNIWDNIKAGAVTAAAFTGVGLFLVGGLLTSTVIGAGNAIASACAANPVACAKAGAVLGLVDPLEELVLNGQLLIETVTGNPHAAETALELQFEQMDGGAPGNTAFFKIQQVFMRNADEVAGFIKKYGDDAFRYLNKVVDVDLANVNLEQGYVVSKLAQELDIPITITGRWADTPAEALLRERASDELKVLVSQGVNIDLAKVQIGQKYGINPHQVKVSTGDPEVDVFIPREAWDKLLPEQQAKIAEELKIFNVDNDPKFKVDFYQNLSLERIELGWPDPQTNIPPGSIIFSPDGTVTHEPFVFP